MGIQAGQLLQALASGIVPGDRQAKVGSNEFGLDFNALLQDVARGAFSSGKPVQPGEGVSHELSPSQAERLSQAVDAADAAGATKLFAVIDGIGVTVDVPSRTIERTTLLEDPSRIDVLPADVLVGIDAVTIVPGEGTGEDAVLSLPGQIGQRQDGAIGARRHIENASLLQYLSSVSAGPSDIHSS